MSNSICQVVLIDKGGKLKQTSIETDDNNPLSVVNKRLLYTACKYKLTSKSSNNDLDGFEILHRFTKDSFPGFTRNKCGMNSSTSHEDTILLFGKSDGKAGNENKYEFPPPIDNQIFFGNLCLVKCSISYNEDAKDESDNMLMNLEKREWEKLYELLFGGFDDCEQSEEEEPDVLDQISDKKKTKDGYLKDGFVVDDDEDVSDEDEYAETDLSDEEEFQFSDED